MGSQVREQPAGSRTQGGGEGAPGVSPPAQQAWPRQSHRDTHTSRKHTQSNRTLFTHYLDGCSQRREAPSYSVSQRARGPRWPLRRVEPVGPVGPELVKKAVGQGAPAFVHQRRTQRPRLGISQMLYLHAEFCRSCSRVRGPAGRGPRWDSERAGGSVGHKGGGSRATLVDSSKKVAGVV